jgi:hypothetical protein
MLNMVTVAALVLSIAYAKIQYSSLKSQQRVRIRCFRHGNSRSPRI